jgi:hypothetical protein
MPLIIKDDFFAKRKDSLEVGQIFSKVLSLPQVGALTLKKNPGD